MVSASGVLCKVTMASLMLGAMAKGGCLRNGDVSMVIDGVPADDSKLMQRHKGLTFLLDRFSLGQNMVVQNVRKYAKAHNFGYRLNSEINLQIDEAKAVDELDRAQRRFAELFGLKLQYVLFSANMNEGSLAILKKAAKDRGLTVIEHNLYLDVDSKIAKDDTMIALNDPSSTSVIALTSAHGREAKEIVKSFVEYASHNHYRLVAIDQCLGEASADSSSDSFAGNPSSVVDDSEVAQSVEESRSPIKDHKGKQRHRHIKVPLSDVDGLDSASDSLKERKKGRKDRKEPQNAKKILVNVDDVMGAKKGQKVEKTKPVLKGQKMHALKNKSDTADPDVVVGKVDPKNAKKNDNDKESPKAAEKKDEKAPVVAANTNSANLLAGNMIAMVAAAASAVLCLL